MKNVLVIGDIHGNTELYNRIISSHSGTTIQVGDFGLHNEHRWHLDNVNSNLHKINFGNHDDTKFLNEAHSLGNWSYNETEDGHRIYTVRGARSIDKNWRCEGVDWWRDEELNYKEMCEAIDAYKWNLPEIVISHAAPTEVQEKLFHIFDRSSTTNGLQLMFEDFQPKIWIFGHYHRSRSEEINGTRFVCLAPGETLLI